MSVVLDPAHSAADARTAGVDGVADVTGSGGPGSPGAGATPGATSGASTSDAARGGARPERADARTAPARTARVARTASTVILVVIALLYLVAAIAPQLLAPASPLATDPLAVLQAPSLAHPLGTDPVGRDVLSRIIYGARYSLTIGVGASLIAAVLGIVIGVLSGLAPRAIDEVIVRVLDVVNAFPELLLALVVITIIGPGPTNVLVAIGVASVPRFARVVRAQVQRLRHSGWVEIALTQGLSAPRRVLTHIVPNTLGPVVVLATIGTGGAIINAAGLSFVGLGPQPPAPEWGAMLSESRDYLQLGWWIAVFPGVAVVLAVATITILGRRLQRHYEGRAR